MYVEVDSNPNCEHSIFIRFRELGQARPVVQVRVSDRVSMGEWCQVTGWQEDPSAPRCLALARPVEDSGAGVAYLVTGGNWGLRLKPLDLDEGWSLESSRQWGEAYLLLADQRDVRFADDVA
ncbi:MAG TPA: hypothetical protein VGQ07_04850 [Nitrospirales bacterium]|nr:hypothetical protein [Nitrospirales bacterium]